MPSIRLGFCVCLGVGCSCETCVVVPLLSLALSFKHDKHNFARPKSSPAKKFDSYSPWHTWCSFCVLHLVQSSRVTFSPRQLLP